MKLHLDQLITKEDRAAYPSVLTSAARPAESSSAYSMELSGGLAASNAKYSVGSAAPVGGKMRASGGGGGANSRKSRTSPYPAVMTPSSVSAQSTEHTAAVDPALTPSNGPPPQPPPPPPPLHPQQSTSSVDFRYAQPNYQSPVPDVYSPYSMVGYGHHPLSSGDHFANSSTAYDGRTGGGPYSECAVVPRNASTSSSMMDTGGAHANISSLYPPQTATSASYFYGSAGGGGGGGEHSPYYRFPYEAHRGFFGSYARAAAAAASGSVVMDLDGASMHSTSPASSHSTSEAGHPQGVPNPAGEHFKRPEATGCVPEEAGVGRKGVVPSVTTAYSSTPCQSSGSSSNSHPPCECPSGDPRTPSTAAAALLSIYTPQAVSAAAAAAAVAAEPQAFTELYGRPGGGAAGTSDVYAAYHHHHHHQHQQQQQQQQGCGLASSPAHLSAPCLSPTTALSHSHHPLSHHPQHQALHASSLQQQHPNGSSSSDSTIDPYLSRNSYSSQSRVPSHHHLSHQFRPSVLGGAPASRQLMMTANPYPA